MKCNKKIVPQIKELSYREGSGAIDLLTTEEERSDKRTHDYSLENSHST